MKTRVSLWSAHYNLYVVKYKKKWWHLWSTVGHYIASDNIFLKGKFVEFVYDFGDYDKCINSAKNLLKDDKIEQYEKNLEEQKKVLKQHVKDFNSQIKIQPTITFKK